MSDELNQTEKEELETLRMEKKSGMNKELYCKVSQKGALSVYGMGRFPVTLYAGQWEKLIKFTDTILCFIADHSDKLSRKD